MTTSRVLLTIGDPNGIGPEIAVKAAVALAREPQLAPILVADRFVLEPLAHASRLHIRETDGTSAAEPAVLDLLPVDAFQLQSYRPGEVSAAAGAATVAYLEKAIKYVKSGRARAIVGCPHSQAAVNAAGVEFSGYPGLLARLMGVAADRVFLMLVGGGLRIVHATLHERLGDALMRLTPELIEAAAHAAAQTLKTLGIESPRLGIFGINPHAGERGLFGDDDSRITVPAVDRLRHAGVNVEGPAGADVLIGEADFDAFIAMYHDQGHIPIKLLAGRAASALSIGAGVTFSSVGHGVGFDIAGKGVADPEGVIRAIRLVASASAPSRRS
jgi:4-hydroxy-L-threonine phosphate dehydrogenase PdxA